MKTSDLVALRNISAAELDAAQAHVAMLRAQEDLLRQHISDLEAQFENAAIASPETWHRMRNLGAQHLWANWMRDKRRDQNLSLARLLLEKSEAEEILRSAFGRHHAVEALLQDAQNERKRKLSHQAFDAQMSMHMLK